MNVIKSLSTTIRITSDVWLREDGKIQQLLPSSALRMMDHHLIASGIFPRVESSGDNFSSNNNNIHEHEWLCVSQAITCYSVESLAFKSVQKGLTTFTHVWVTSVGKSSLQLGNVIMLEDEILAAAQRVYVRKFQGKSAPFSDREQERFEKVCGWDESMLDYLLNPPTLPLMEKFGTFIPNFEPDVKAILRLQVGPQHTNMGNHADHSSLAEAAVHALVLANLSGNSLAINYLSEVMMGQELECMVHEDRIFIVRPIGGGKQVLVLVAKATVALQ